MDGDINVRIVADSSSFIADVQKAASAAKTSFDQIESSVETASTETTASLGSLQRSLKAAQDQLAQFGSGSLAAGPLQSYIADLKSQIDALKAATPATAAAPVAAAQPALSAVTFSSQSIQEAVDSATRLDATLKSAEASARVFGTSVGASATAAAERLQALSQASVVTGQSIQQAISAATGLDASNRSAAESASVFERALGTQSERAAELRDRNSSLAAATKVSSEATRDAIDRVTGISAASKSAADSASVFESALGTQAQRAGELRQAMAGVAPAQAQASQAAQQAASAMGAEGQKAAELRAQLAVAQQQLAQFNAELRNLAAAPAGTPGLPDALRQTAAAAEQSRAQVRDLSLEMQKLGTDADHAGNTMNHGALREGLVVIREFSRGDFTRLGGSLTILADRMNLLRYVMNPVGIGIAAIGGAMVLASVRSEETARALGSMQAALDASGRGSEYSEAKFRQLITTLHELHGVSHEDAVEMLQGFTRNARLSVDQYEALGEAAAGYARITGEKLPDAAKTLEKAVLGDREALYELNAQYLRLAPAQLQAIEDAQQHGDKAKAQSLIVSALKDKLAGLAQDGLTPTQQASDRLKSAWDYLASRFGDTSTMDMARNGLAAMIDTITTLIGIAPRAGDAIASMNRPRSSRDTKDLQDPGAVSTGSAEEAGFVPLRQLGRQDRSLVPPAAAGNEGRQVLKGDGGTAVGMFQLHEPAAQDVGLSSSDRYDYNKNIYGGSAYFLKRLQAQGGDLDAATRAYNEGDGNKESAKGYRYQSDVKGQNVAAMDPKVSADIDEALDAQHIDAMLGPRVADAVRARVKQIAMQESGGGKHFVDGAPSNGGPVSNATGGSATAPVDHHDQAAATNPEVPNYGEAVKNLNDIDGYLKQQRELQTQVNQARNDYNVATATAKQYDEQAAAAEQAGNAEGAASLRQNAAAARQTASEALAAERSKQNQLNDLVRTGEQSRMQVLEQAAKEAARTQGNLLHENQQAYADVLKQGLAAQQWSAAEQAQIQEKIKTAEIAAHREGLQNFIAAEREKQAAARENGTKVLEIEEEILARMRAANLQGTREYEAELRRQLQLKRQYALEAAQMELQSVEKQISTDQRRTSALRSSLSEQVDSYRISFNSMIQQVAGLENAEYASNHRRLQDLRATLGEYPKEQQKVDEQIEALEARHTASMAQLNREAAQHARQAWEEAISPIESGFDGMISSLASGQQTVGQAAAKAAASVVEEYAKMGLKAGFHWLTAQLGMTTATQAGEATRTATTATGATTREAIQAQEAGPGLLSRIASTIAGWLGFETAKTGATASGAAARTTIGATESLAAVNRYVTQVAAHAGLETTKTVQTGTGATARVSMSTAELVSELGKAATATGAHAAAETTRTAATATGSATRTAIGTAETGGSFLARIASAIAGWLGMETTKTAATTAGSTTRVAEEAAAATSAAAVTSATNVAAVESNAAVGAAAAGASAAAIPVTGWAMAPGVAAATFAELSAYAPVAAFDIGAWNLPEDQLAMVHKGEMILPAAESAQVRAGLGRGSFGEVVARVQGGQGAGGATETPTGAPTAAAAPQAAPPASPAPAAPGGVLQAIWQRMVGPAAGATKQDAPAPTAAPSAAPPTLPGYATGAWDLDQDQFAQVHKGEMIVPAAPSAAIRASAPGGFGSLADRITAAPSVGSSVGRDGIAAPGASLSDLIARVNASLIGGAGGAGGAGGNAFALPVSAGFKMPSVPSSAREMAMAGGTSNSSSFKMGDMHFNMPVTGGSAPGGLTHRDLERAMQGVKGHLLDLARNGNLKLPGR